MNNAEKYHYLLDTKESLSFLLNLQVHDYEKIRSEELIELDKIMSKVLKAVTLGLSKDFR